MEKLEAFLSKLENDFDGHVFSLSGHKKELFKDFLLNQCRNAFALGKESQLVELDEDKLEGKTVAKKVKKNRPKDRMVYSNVRQ